jgi:hypothetical protein
MPQLGHVTRARGKPVRALGLRSGPRHGTNGRASMPLPRPIVCSASLASPSAMPVYCACGALVRMYEHRTIVDL